MTLPRRIQLVKLLRANGLRDVERMREDELKEALARLRVVIPDPAKGKPTSGPSSGAFLARSAEPPPVVDDSDDPYALPRFREPKLFLPEGERTFLRAIAVKPRLLFCTWDVRREERERLEGPVELQLFWRDFLGDPPDGAEVGAQPPAARMSVELSSSGWYVTIPGDRLAVVAALVVTSSGRRLAVSNATLAPPARPAPPGPYWLATLPPSLDRRRLRDRSLMTGAIGDLRRVGETDARGLEGEIEDELPASAAALRAPWLQTMPSSSSSSLPSSGSLAAPSGAQPAAASASASGSAFGAPAGPSGAGKKQ